MNNACKSNWDSIVALAHGEKSEAAQVHLEACEACRSKLHELERLVTKLHGAPTAPASWVERAKALMTPRKPVLARLIASTLSAQGARGAGAFQCRYELEDSVAKMTVTRSGDSWQVMGRIDQSGWNGVGFQVDDAGRFETTIPVADELALSFERGEQEVLLLIPTGPADQ